MTKDTIPEKVNPYRLAESASALHGIVSINNMPRLGMSLVDDTGHVSIDTQFGIDENGVRFIKGHIKTELKLQCQRCMEPFFYAIMGDFLSGVVKTEKEADKLSEVYDPVFEEEGMISLLDIVEDELIVSLPIVPMHKAQDCKVDLSEVVSQVNKEAGEDKHNPFKVIEILRTKKS